MKKSHYVGKIKKSDYLSTLKVASLVVTIFDLWSNLGCARPC